MLLWSAGLPLPKATTPEYTPWFVSISSSGKGTVRTYGRVALPEVQVDIRHGLAGPRVDHLHVQIERHALLVLGDVAADKLAGDVCAR